MDQEKNERRSKRRALPFILIGVVLIALVVVLALCDRPNTKENDENVIVKRIYSVCPVLWGDIVSVDLNADGRVVSFGSFFYDLMPSTESDYGYDCKFTYDESGRVIGGKWIFGELINIKYDDEGRMISANFANDGKTNEQLLFVSYNDDGGTTWSFPTKKEHILGTKNNIMTMVFDKNWYCVGGSTRLWKIEVAVADDNTRRVKLGNDQEWIAAYDDGDNLISLTSKDDKWEYQLDEKGNCLSSRSNNTNATCEYVGNSLPAKIAFYENGEAVKKVNKEYDGLYRVEQYIIEEFGASFGYSKVEVNYEYYGNGNQVKCLIRYFKKNGVLISNDVYSYHENGNASKKESTNFSEEGYMINYGISTHDENGDPVVSESKWFYENGQVQSHQITHYDRGNVTSTERFEYDENGKLTDHSKT